jgi:AcrR family transcriptional regulator
MSPRPADPGIRSALIDAAARLVADHGRDALTIRRLASEVGTSTMALYTHFGSMDELMREVKKEGFTRLSGYLQEVRKTSDPVADVAALGWAYSFNAIANPHMYRQMFLEPVDDPEVSIAGLVAYEPLISAVQRCIEAGRFRESDPWSAAMQLWVMLHGAVTLHLGGYFDHETGLDQVSAMATTAFVGFGDEREAAERSIERARRRMERSMPLDAAPAAATPPPSPARTP